MVVKYIRRALENSKSMVVRSRRVSRDSKAVRRLSACTAPSRIPRRHGVRRFALLMLSLLVVPAAVACEALFAQGYLTSSEGSDNVSRPDTALRIALLGDSNTWNGGDSCTKSTSWSYWFRLAMQPCSCVSLARSGATWTHTVRTRRALTDYSERLADHNVVYNQVERLVSAVDSGRMLPPHLIIIMSGTNDAWFAARRPGIYALSVADAFALSADSLLSLPPSALTSLPLAVRYDCERLRRRFPDARLVLLTPYQSVHAGKSAIERVGSLIEECAHRLDLPVLRLDRAVPIRSDKEKAHHRLTTDGTHTSPEGARKAAEVIERFVRPLVFTD